MPITCMKVAAHHITLFIVVSRAASSGNFNGITSQGAITSTRPGAICKKHRHCPSGTFCHPSTNACSGCVFCKENHSLPHTFECPKKCIAVHRTQKVIGPHTSMKSNAYLHTAETRLALLKGAYDLGRATARNSKSYLTNRIVYNAAAADCWSGLGDKVPMAVEAIAHRADEHKFWRRYRLGDVVAGTGSAGLCLGGMAAFATNDKDRMLAVRAAEHVALQDGICGRNGSIARLYSQQAVFSHGESVASRAAARQGLGTGCVPPDNDTAVVHLRLGDTVHQGDWNPGDDHAPFDSNRAFRRAPHCPYVFSSDFYVAAADMLPPTVRRVLLIGSLDHGINPNYAFKSIDYRDAVGRFFEGRGYEVLHRFWGLPDDDFALMTRSSILVPGGGGFAELVAMCTTVFGGLVLTPANYSQCFARVNAPKHPLN